MNHFAVLNTLQATASNTTNWPSVLAQLLGPAIGGVITIIVAYLFFYKNLQKDKQQLLIESCVDLQIHISALIVIQNRIEDDIDTYFSIPGAKTAYHGTNLEKLSHRVIAQCLICKMKTDHTQILNTLDKISDAANSVYVAHIHINDIDLIYETDGAMDGLELLGKAINSSSRTLKINSDILSKQIKNPDKHPNPKIVS